MENILTIENISKYYGNKSNLTKAISNISMNVDKGEFIAIMGASGFRVIIVTVANSLGNIRVFELLPKLKTKKYGWCIA